MFCDYHTDQNEILDKLIHNFDNPSDLVIPILCTDDINNNHCLFTVSVLRKYKSLLYFN